MLSHNLILILPLTLNIASTIRTNIIAAVGQCDEMLQRHVNANFTGESPPPALKEVKMMKLRIMSNDEDLIVSYSASPMC